MTIAEVGEIAEVRAHFVETLLDSYSAYHPKSENSSKTEHLILHSLNKAHSWIIAKANKDNAVVVSDSDDYDKKGLWNF